MGYNVAHMLALAKARTLPWSAESLISLAQGNQVRLGQYPAGYVMQLAAARHGLIGSTRT